MPSSSLPVNQYLRRDEYLTSSDGRFFAILQADGNFCVYTGASPNPNQGFVWESNQTGKNLEYFAIMQDDGNFCVYEGTDPAHKGRCLWESRSKSKSPQLSAVMQDDGNFCIYDFGQNPPAVVWATHTYPYNKIVTEVPTAFLALNDHGEKQGFDINDLSVDMEKSHVQGIARHDDCYLITHNLTEKDHGYIFVLDIKKGKIAYRFNTPDGYSHPGGCQQIGSFLAVATENETYSKSVIRFYNLSNTTASSKHQPKLLSFKIKRDKKGTGGVGITNYTDSAGKECYFLAAMNDRNVDFYKSDNRPISDPGIHFNFLFEATLDHSGYSEVCLVTGTTTQPAMPSPQIYMLGFRMVEDGNKDWVDLYAVHEVDQAIALRDSRHLYTDSTGGPGDEDGVHFRWAGGVRISPDGLVLLTAQHDMKDESLDFNVNTFA